MLAGPGAVGVARIGVGESGRLLPSAFCRRGRIGPAAAERILPGGSVLAGPGAVGVARPPVPSRSIAGGLARFEAASAERVRIAGSGVSIVCMSGRTVEN